MSEKIILDCSRSEFKEMLMSIVNEALQKVKQNVALEEYTDVLSRKEALKFIGCSSPTLVKLQKEGLPYYRLGKKVFFRKSEVLEFSRYRSGDNCQAKKR